MYLLGFQYLNTSEKFAGLTTAKFLGHLTHFIGKLLSISLIQHFQNLPTKVYLIYCISWTVDMLQYAHVVRPQTLNYGFFNALPYF